MTELTTLTQPTGPWLDLIDRGRETCQLCHCHGGHEPDCLVSRSRRRALELAEAGRNYRLRKRDPVTGIMTLRGLLRRS
jgi:hypothetical protein